MGTEPTPIASDPAELPDHAELMTRGAVADIWAQLQAAAEAGDADARQFLQMFGPFAAERLAGRANT